MLLVAYCGRFEQKHETSLALSCQRPVRELCARAERSKHHMRPHVSEYQTELIKTAMTTSFGRRGVYRGALAAAGYFPC